MSFARKYQKQLDLINRTSKLLSDKPLEGNLEGKGWDRHMAIREQGQVSRVEARERAKQEATERRRLDYQMRPSVTKVYHHTEFEIMWDGT